MKFFPLLLLMLAVFPASAQQADGRALFEQLCVSCHVVSGQPTLAPPIFAVKNHLMARYPQREAFIQRIVDWVAKPDASQALMPGALRRFGLMPQLPYDPSEVSKVAAYLYDSNMQLPDWYRQHFQAEHGVAPAQ